MGTSSEKDLGKETSSDIITPKNIGNYLKEKHYPLWVCINHHKTHTNKNMTMVGHNYIKDILCDKANKRVIKKSTQGGISECLIVISWSATVKGNVVFYVLPTHQLKDRFVSNRYEKSLAYSPYYRSFKRSNKSLDFKLSEIENKSLKDIGKGVINFAGSKSDVPFIEIPADWFIVDEADMCDPKRLEMGKERLGHSSNPYEIYVGNPTFVGSFLDEKFKESTKSVWHIRCHCGHFIKIDFFKHVVEQVGESEYVIRDKNFEYNKGLDIQPICDKCEKPFDRFGLGEYVGEQESDISGKHISRLFSGTTQLIQLVKNFDKGLENDYRMQRFYNSDLGESYTAKGSKITTEDLNLCVRDYLMPNKSTNPCIMGVDVGKVLNVIIGRPLGEDKIKIVYINTVQELYEIKELISRYKVVCGVIDGLPEIRLAKRFCAHFMGGFRWFKHNEKKDTIDLNDKIINANRTVLLDRVKEEVMLKNILLPKNASDIEDFYPQMIASTRVFDEEKKVYNWEEGALDDHYMFSMGYIILAKRFLAMVGGR